MRTGFSDDFNHPCFDVQKDRICFGRCNGAYMNKPPGRTYALNPSGPRSQRSVLLTNLRTSLTRPGTSVVTAHDLSWLICRSGGNWSVKTTGFDIADVVPNQLRCY